MSSIVDSPDVLAALQQRKLAIRRKLDASRQQMTEKASYLTGSSAQKKADRLQGIGRIIINGIVVYRGIRFCSEIFTGIHSLFSSRKRRR